MFTDSSTDELITAIPTLTLSPAPPTLTGSRVLIVGASVGGLAAAACLRAAGFTRVHIAESCTEHGVGLGAGVGLDDVSVSILKGLGALQPGSCAFQKMRWTEDRTSDGQLLCRQPFPYFAARYAEVRSSLAALLPAASIQYGRAVESVQEKEDSILVMFADRTSNAYDMVIGADGPRSPMRQQLFLQQHPSLDEGMRFAGYFAWRGVVTMVELGEEAVRSLHAQFPLCGNCLYFVHGDKQHAVVYHIGNGLINWLVYVNSKLPAAKPGRTTSTATPDDINRLRASARRQWGDGLGRVIEATPEPFRTDVYDIQTPLQSLARGRCAVLGDSAHPITPHMAKGSNLALHDAFALACSAHTCSNVESLLQAYSVSRADETARTVLFSRFLGQLRNGLLPGMEGMCSKQEFDSLVEERGWMACTLPMGPMFLPVWRFLDQSLADDARGFFLRKSEQMPKVGAFALNHISLETANVQRLSYFYKDVLGLQQLTTRPNFGFGGTWFQITPHTQLHIIEKDPQKTQTIQGNVCGDVSALPQERFIRRSHHFAFTVADIEATKLCLIHHGIPYAINSVPGTPITQLFVFDPDGNGIEIGNFEDKSTPISKSNL